jgi:uncharacterized protein (TIGR00661 family)
MGTIFYSVSGEGRGHATRARAMIEELRNEHHIVIHTPGQAYDLLSPLYSNHPNVEVRKIPGLLFHYGRNNKLQYRKTIVRGIQYLLQMPDLIRRLQDSIETEGADLVITDFEPALPRAARRAGIPFISINHQHFLLTYDLSSLPASLRRHATLMAQVVRSYYRGQEETVVSSFYFPPLRKGCSRVTQIGVLLRPEIITARRDEGSHLVCYLRRFTTPAVLDALERCGCEVRIYGLGARPSRGNLRFLNIDALRFVEDLATSRALVSTAGNQLVGEALFLGKPVLAMPEPGNYEQHINAHFLEQSGTGMIVDLAHLTLPHIRSFMDRLDDYKALIHPERLNGNIPAVAIINHNLEKRLSTAKPRIPVTAPEGVTL